MKEFLKLSSILALICCASALALGSVYELTKEPIARQQQLKKQRAVKAVFPDLPLGSGMEGTAVALCADDETEPCREIFIVTDGGRIGGIGLEALASGYSGPIDLMVGLLPDGTLSGVKVISHSETPGLGAKITAESFCAQFSGLAGDASAWNLRKSGGEIDQVTGATISSAAVLQAVQDQVRFFNENRMRILHAQAHRDPETPCPQAKN